MVKRTGVSLLLAIIAAVGLDVLSGEGGFVSPAEAIIGRPLTPLSVAGVARRTVRRCAVGVYYC